MTDRLDHIDDLDAYIATYDDAERDELRAAELALDVSLMLQRARQNRSLSQSALAKLLDLTQQSISRIEQAGSNVTIATVSRYLAALGYDLQMVVTELETGSEVSRVHLQPSAVSRDEAVSATIRQGFSSLVPPGEIVCTTIRQGFSSERFWAFVTKQQPPGVEDCIHVSCAVR